ncbi:MAG: tRNA epoxyqueuosine(34) reductase QueG [Balneolaceae bacterium]
MDRHALTYRVRMEASKLGFDACGFTRAEPLDREARRLEEWLSGELHGSMRWMENHFDKRINPQKLVPGTVSVISVIASYHFPRNLDFDRKGPAPRIAKYARGRDYHKVFKQRLRKLFQYIEDEAGGCEGRVFTDSAPVMDKVWAQRGGLGWIGKNANLLNREAGSFFLIGEILVDIPFLYDAPATDHCGSCTLCIDACPTDAIHKPYSIDSNRCISYLTIELKESIPEEYHDEMGEWMFGCDICQDVCPWNRKARNGSIDDLRPREKLLITDPGFWSHLSEEVYNDLFEGTPVRRAKYSKFRENAELASKNVERQKQGHGSTAD